MDSDKPPISDAIVANFIFKIGTQLLTAHSKSVVKKKRNSTYRNTDIVYHYTSFNSLYKIICSESLIASNALYLNDTREFKDSIAAFELSLVGLLENKKTSKFKTSLIEAILADIKIVNIAENYVTCFSASKDLLSQWIAYGDRGNGLAIGFKINELNRCFQYFPSGAWVEYDAFKKMTVIDKLNKEFFVGYRGLVKNVSFKSEQQEIQLATEIYLKHLMPNFLAHYKHSSFSEEKEYRLALREENAIPLPLLIEFMAKDKSLIVPYTKLILGHRVNRDAEDDFLEDQQPTVTHTNGNIRLPIKEIVLGPCVDLKFTSPGLKMFLQSKGYEDVKISQSYIPLRNI